ncbi:MAG TPA: sulfatase-like hydrolase/transferase [Chitinophagaceae bacterium]|nr:sulfatase-like hydrolase/transferase [Chitinophagaceae bacterium]
MKKVLYKKSLYLFLLPFFFVCHGYIENFGLITVGDCIALLTSYWIATGILYGLFFLFYRNAAKASIAAGLLLSFYFFFGAMHDFLKAHTSILHRYIIILPAFFVLFICLILYLKKSRKDFFKVGFFFNTLLIVYLFIDAGNLIWEITHPGNNKLSVYGFGKKDMYLPCKDCTSPDIYFLVFDEYSSSVSLSRTFQYNNSELDSFFLQHGFHIQSHSFSNYNFTQFSVASILNMNYINGINDTANITPDDHTNSLKLIKNNAVINFLSSRNYDILNYSIFDLAGSPSPVEVSLLPVKTRLITAQTLFASAKRDIGLNFNIGWLLSYSVYDNLNNNNKLLALIKNESTKPSKNPRFIYGHFEMPHWPFYFDQNMHPRNEADLLAGNHAGHQKDYTGYIPYTNDKLKELVNTIQKNTQRSAVIIVMGDHGYRVHVNGFNNDHYFTNLNAIYFPGQDYHLLKDSVSGVNQFRIIFNTLFNQALPLLKDSSVLLNDKIR